MEILLIDELQKVQLVLPIDFYANQVYIVNSEMDNIWGGIYCL